MDKNNPLLSVIVPIYNVEKYLPEALDSIINQTYINLEIILVDDGSPDNCPKICDEYARTDPRIKVIHKKNGGVSSARNEGIKIASGTWITFVDPDDWVDKDFYQKIFSIENYDKADIIFTNDMYREYVNTTVKNPNCFDNSFYTDKENINILLARILAARRTGKDSIHAAVSTKLYSSRVLSENSIIFEDLRFSEDMIFNLFFLLKSKSVLTLDICGYHYRQRKGSAMNCNIKDTDILTAVSIMEKVHTSLEKESLSEITGAVHAQAIRLISFFLLRISKYGAKMSYKEKSKIINELKNNTYFKEAVFFDSNEFLRKKQIVLKKCLQLNTNIPLFVLGKLNIIQKNFKDRRILYD